MGSPFSTPAPEITRLELRDLLRSPPVGFCLVDVRVETETDRGTIPSANLLPLNFLASALTMHPTEFRRIFKFLKPELDDPIVTYCHSGRRAVSGCKIFANAGYTKCSVYRGSWVDWSQHMIRGKELD